MKRTLSILVTTMLSWAAWSAPGVGGVNFGITNATLAANTTYTNRLYDTNYSATILGNLSAAPMQYNSHATLVFSGTVIVTNASTVTVKVLPTDDGNIPRVDGTPPLAWVFSVPSTGADGGTPKTNAFTAITNVPLSFVGAASGLSLYSVQNGSTGGALTSPVLHLKVKNLISPNQ